MVNIGTSVVDALEILVNAMENAPNQVVFYKEDKPIRDVSKFVLRLDERIFPNAPKTLEKMTVYIDNDQILHFIGKVIVNRITIQTQRFTHQHQTPSVIMMSYNPQGSIVKNSEIMIHMFDTGAKADSFMAKLGLRTVVVPQNNYDISDIRRIVRTYRTELSAKSVAKTRSPKMHVAPAAGGSGVKRRRGKTA